MKTRSVISKMFECQWLWLVTKQTTNSSSRTMKCSFMVLPKFSPFLNLGEAFLIVKVSITEMLTGVVIDDAHCIQFFLSIAKISWDFQFRRPSRTVSNRLRPILLRESFQKSDSINANKARKILANQKWLQISEQTCGISEQNFCSSQSKRYRESLFFNQLHRIGKLKVTVVLCFLKSSNC